MILTASNGWLIGSIPLVGDIFDIGYKSKIRNVALIRDHMERTGQAIPRADGDAPLLPKDDAG
ncbi:DUF4112 domain-containing protein [Pseudooctadecabacter sp.]|uniref:DUF4112 domain-containing protein n=1 Tax=Pseudooctadecabacter sp. TaxID=1966338 RepID=UPI0035C7C66A